MVRNILRKLWAGRALIAKLAPFVGVGSVAVIGFMIGRMWVSPAQGQTGPNPLRPAASAYDDEYSKRYVATIYDTIPVTREELGEFLIARYGADRLDMLVTRKIVEMACRTKGIEVTDEVVEQQLDREIKGLNPTMTRKDFQNQILRRFNKTLYEYKEDAVRTKLMLAELARPSVVVTDEDLRKGFEGRYGEKVECRMIVLPKDRHNSQTWEKVHESETEFDKAARTQYIPQLASAFGKVPPVHRYFGDPTIEKVAFSLSVGEVSGLIEMPDNTVIILKCDRKIPRDPTKRFEEERASLLAEMKDLKLSQQIPELLAKLRKEANPKLLLRHETRQEELERTVLPEISGQGTRAPVTNKAGG